MRTKADRCGMVVVVVVVVVVVEAKKDTWIARKIAGLVVERSKSQQELNILSCKLVGSLTLYLSIGFQSMKTGRCFLVS